MRTVLSVTTLRKYHTEEGKATGWLPGLFFYTLRQLDDLIKGLRKSTISVGLFLDSKFTEKEVLQSLFYSASCKF